MCLESDRLLKSYVNGSDDAAREIYDKYLLRLIGLVQKRISDPLKSRFDPEDVVHSAYRSFFRRARGGQFTLERNGDLWRLLAAITLKKLFKRVKWEFAIKRSPKQELPESPLQEILAAPPSHEADVILVEQMERLIEGLSDRDAKILELRLQGESIQTISPEVGTSEATVRRVLRQAHDKLEKNLSE